MIWEGTPLERGRFLRRWAATIIGLLTVIACTIAIIAYVNTGALDRRLDPLEQAPCRLDPGSKLCHKSIDGFIRTLTPYQAHLIQEIAHKYRKKNDDH